MRVRSLRAVRASAAEKMSALTAAGVHVVESPAEIGHAVASALQRA